MAEKTRKTQKEIRDERNAEAVPALKELLDTRHPGMFKVGVFRGEIAIKKQS